MKLVRSQIVVFGFMFTLINSPFTAFGEEKIDHQEIALCEDQDDSAVLEEKIDNQEEQISQDEQTQNSQKPSQQNIVFEEESAFDWERAKPKQPEPPEVPKVPDQDEEDVDENGDPIPKDIPNIDPPTDEELGSQNLHSSFFKTYKERSCLNNVFQKEGKEIAFNDEECPCKKKKPPSGSPVPSLPSCTSDSVVVTKEMTEASQGIAFNDEECPCKKKKGPPPGAPIPSSSSYAASSISTDKMTEEGQIIVLEDSECPCKRKKLPPPVEVSANEEKKTKTEGVSEECILDNFSHMVIRHIEGGGVGYRKGYTTVNFFYAPILSGTAFPFFDLRVHVIDNGKLAANFGLGVRYRPEEHSFGTGINVFYDMRRHRYSDYQQIVAGWEWIQERFFIALNGYFPFGPKVRYRVITPIDAEHYQEEATLLMTGGNLEIEGHAYHSRPFDLFLNVKPYVFKGAFGKCAAGAEAGVYLHFYDVFYVGGNISYDQVFHTKEQVEGGFTFFFGGNQKDRRSNLQSSSPEVVPALCSASKLLRRKLAESTHRKDLLVISEQSRTRNY